MAINFPNSPSANAVYTYGGNSWQWDGESWNSIGAGGGSFTVTMTPVFIGALMNLSTTIIITSTSVTKVNCNNVIYDTSTGSGLTSNSTNSVFTIPSGVSKVRLSGAVTANSQTGQIFAQIYKNGAATFSSVPDTDTAGGDGLTIVTPVLDVSQNDYFQLMTAVESASTPRSYGAAQNTWFAIEVVEGSALSNTATLAPAGPQGVQGVQGAAGAGSPGGSNTHIQFNNSSAFGGTSNLTFNLASNTLSTYTLNVTNSISMQSATLAATPTAGLIEYDGKVVYSTPQATQRGVIPGMQYFRINSNTVLSNTTSAQGVFGTGSGSGLGVTLSSNTVYAFEGLYILVKTVGTANVAMSYGFGGTATINNIGYRRDFIWSSTGLSSPRQNFADILFGGYVQTTASTSLGAAGIENTTTASQSWVVPLQGTVSVNVGGTFIPQFTTSALVGPYSIVMGSYFLIYPIGAASANVSVGTWA
jgi:hypothetical protein